MPPVPAGIPLAEPDTHREVAARIRRYLAAAVPGDRSRTNLTVVGLPARRNARPEKTFKSNCPFSQVNDRGNPLASVTQIYRIRIWKHTYANLYKTRYRIEETEATLSITDRYGQVGLDSPLFPANRS